MAVTAMSVGLGNTEIAVLARLFAALSSASACVATSRWMPSAAPVVFQGKTSVLLVPTARPPAIVCVPSVVPDVESRNVTVMSLAVFWLPTFVTVTPMLTPWPTITVPEGGVLTLLTAMSVNGASTGIVAER